MAKNGNDYTFSTDADADALGETESLTEEVHDEGLVELAAQEESDPYGEPEIDDHQGAGDATEVTVPDGVDNDTSGVEDQELEAIKARVREMEEEAEKLKEMQTEVEKQMNLSGSSVGSPGFPSVEEKIETDARSIYVGNVDYGATAEELEAHFHGCGSVNRVTILCDKFTGHPKGFAYIEFADKDSVQTAMALDDSLFRGRQIKCSAKRTNRPGISTTNRGRARGRGGRGGRAASFHGGYRPRRPFRARRNWYSPY